MTTMLQARRNPHLLRSFQRFNVTVDFFEFLSTEFNACSKQPSRDRHCKVSYPRMQLNVTRVRVEPRSCNHDHHKNGTLTLSATLPTCWLLLVSAMLSTSSKQKSEKHTNLSCFYRLDQFLHKTVGLFY